MNKKVENFELWNNLKKSWVFAKNQKKRLVLYFFVSLILCIISAIVPILSAQALLKITGGLFNQLILVALAIFVIEIIY